MHSNSASPDPALSRYQDINVLHFASGKEEHAAYLTLKSLISILPQRPSGEQTSEATVSALAAPVILGITIRKRIEGKNFVRNGHT